MTPPTIQFAPLSAVKRGTVLVRFVAEDTFQDALRSWDQETGGAVSKAVTALHFKPRRKSVLDILAPHGMDAGRLLIVGLGDSKTLSTSDWTDIGGVVRGKISGKATDVDVVADMGIGAEAMTSFALGFTLRSYSFRKYKTNKKRESEEENPADNSDDQHRVVIHCGDVHGAENGFKVSSAVAAGIYFARDLVNEPANILTPREFANRLRQLEGEGVKVEVLDAAAMTRLGMGALLAVNQGSAQAPYTVVMRWEGEAGKSGADPLVLVGKGVCFDTGGISIKPAAGMEDMKGDMAGAAAVAGVMLTLARRKTRAHVVGLVGLVENMPSATAQRPGDIVTSASGQTIEVLNTDAEGRLVLADVMWYAQEHFKPKAMITLATLTGAIIVALGKENAGLFSNDDALATRLTEAGLATGDTVWRMPLSKKYNKMIDSKIADVKNIGGRDAGSITAAQFLQRFVNKGVAWAHLDVAGTAMASPSTDTNTGWASGYGVRLLDRLCADSYE